MTEVNDSYKTATKTDNGLIKELIAKYKQTFDIKSTTRIYDMYTHENLLDFYIEKPNKGKGTITYNKNSEKEVVYTFFYKPS